MTSKKVKDLNADELADYAFYLFIHTGRHAIGAGLIYRCIELDQNNPLGLRCLSDFLDWRGSESISALILEYLIQNKLSKTPENQKEIERLLFTCKWVWGFSKHKSGKTQLSGDEFDDEDAFEVNTAGYNDFKQSTFETVGDWDTFLKGAHNLIGCYAGVVSSPTLKETDSPVNTIRINDFSTNSEYVEFLENDTMQFERIKAQIKQGN